ncbi:MAG: 3-phosphoshikimate 1-carboxyvinyltransferase [Lachnospiraceae bacterium]|nr:3-phosphoshikimate 1-carboxyvinyltransferase [Lachnospiraceae bacterium]
MLKVNIDPVHRLRGEISVPGDKSISHRGIMFGAIAEGTTELDGFLDGADCRSTIACFRALGIDIEQTGTHITVHGKGLHGLQAPDGILDVGNSGTTMRLISGILSAQDFSCVLTGDASIQKRPMKRIMDPLTEMGAGISSERNDGCAPLHITGSRLHGITCHTPVASAQVKSCILLAGLYADSETQVIEPALSRNHTELMLRAFGADLTTEGTSTVILPHPTLLGQHIQIPGDISSAAYFLAAGALVADSELVIKNVNTNPTRAGILTVLADMGADVTLENARVVSGEKVADLIVRSSSLHGVTVGGDLIPRLIDELPVIAVLAAYADGETVIKDAGELRVKESDRIALITDNLKAMGCDITPTEDGMVIRGGRPLHGTNIRTAKDHRIAMAFAVAGLAADGATTFDDADCVNISFPGFFPLLRRIDQLQ